MDENVLWNEPDISLVSLFDNEGGLEVADPVTKLCKLASRSNVWGLPHVLRCISKEGVKVVQDVLSNSMPDSFFPWPMPFSNKDGYTLQVLASVQVTDSSGHQVPHSLCDLANSSRTQLQEHYNLNKIGSEVSALLLQSVHSN